MNMRHVMLLSVACLALPYFLMLCHKMHGFREEIIERGMCVLISLQFFSDTFLVLTV